MTKPENGTIDLAVSFGNVSVGDKTTRIGVSIDRALLPITKADRTLCGKRLGVQLVWKQNGDHPDQAELPGMEPLKLRGVADVKHFGVSTSDLSCGLTFAKASIDVSDLSKFAQRSGTLRIESVDDIPEEESDEDEGDEAEAKPRRRRRAAAHEQDDSWRAVAIRDAFGEDFSKPILEKLGDAGVDMLGDLADLFGPH